MSVCRCRYQAKVGVRTSTFFGRGLVNCFAWWNGGEWGGRGEENEQEEVVVAKSAKLPNLGPTQPQHDHNIGQIGCSQHGPTQNKSGERRHISEVIIKNIL